MIEAVLLGLSAGLAMLALYWEREAWRERDRRRALDAGLRKLEAELAAMTEHHRQVALERARRERVQGAGVFAAGAAGARGALLGRARFSRN